jgi:hypothetical protein
MKRWVRLSGLFVIPFVVGGLFACSGMSWNAAKKADSIAGYHRFLRDHPSSRHAPEAKERLEYLRVETHPSVKAFRAFEHRFPNSPLVPDLRATAEPHFFKEARDENSTEAYQRFLEQYPEGAFSARAQGNQVYLERVQPDPTSARLSEFADAYPESDFAPLARRTQELLKLRDGATIRRLAVRVRVGRTVEQRERVRQGFGAVARAAYAERAVHAFLIRESDPVPADADGWMQIDYDEVPAEGTFGARTMLSHCRVRLFHREVTEPVWDRTFESSADHLDQAGQREDPTVFGSRAYRFWGEFFVPVSTWPTSRTRIYRHEFSEPVRTVDVLGNRAVVLLQDGSLEYMDLSNPLEPAVLRRYRHQRDLTRWQGVVLLPEHRAVAYGPDGAELVDLSKVNTQRLMRWERMDVGQVVGGALSGETVLLAGDRGLYAVRAMKNPATLHRLTDEPLVGVTVRDLHVLMASEIGVNAADVHELVKWAVAGSGASAPAVSRVRFPDDFGAKRAEPAGDSLFVFGKTSVLEVSVKDPKHLSLVNHLTRDKDDLIRDVVPLNGRLFVLGKRGLEVSDRMGESVSDLIQVEADERVVATDRFLVLTGGPLLEIVDAGPYRSGAASPLR